jgi:hypothetical protein
VPFQFRRLVGEQLRVGSFVESTDGVRVAISTATSPST